ncbi:hypothetical protein GIB67_027784 [Kingdonia uniflora]|uniref:Uncharacterized protein n=1 Tax=Kingdonia uniflora TaxID=39325 RepID=A0A7J7PD54_9MAGN|nr:hypothetical protein GIB67_027784 [Kingdonia uniflora]
MRYKYRQPMDHEVYLEDNGVEKEDNGDEGVFATGTSTFIITDDLQIMSMSTAASLALMKNLDVMDMKALEEMIFDVSLEQKLYLPDLVCFQRRYPIQTSRLEDISIVDKKIAFKITVRKSIQKVLFAEAEEDFINFLFSLLIFPVVLNPKSSTSSTDGGYMTGLATFMVIDNLVVAHLYPISWFSFLESQNVPADDLEERMVSMGTTEALQLLEACFIFKSALTEVFVSDMNQKGLKQKRQGGLTPMSQNWISHFSQAFADDGESLATYVDPECIIVMKMESFKQIGLQIDPD